MLDSSIGRLRLIGIIEGLSYLLLTWSLSRLGLDLGRFSLAVLNIDGFLSLGAFHLAAILSSVFVSVLLLRISFFSTQLFLPRHQNLH